VVLAIVEFYVLFHLRIPIITRSISPVVLWHEYEFEYELFHHDKRMIRSGEYVTYDQYAPKPVDGVVRLIKRVGCGPGELLSTDANGYYYCNGRYLAAAKREVAGKPITPFLFNGIVPRGELFVIGDAAGSYDSRVYGFIDRNRIKGVAWALL
jgi:signal peptidase I